MCLFAKSKDMLFARGDLSVFINLVVSLSAASDVACLQKEVCFSISMIFKEANKMKCYWSIAVLCGLVCIFSTGCKPTPDPVVWSTTGDVKVGEITFSPDPVIANQDASISFKLTNVGATNVRPIDAHIQVIGPISPGISGGTTDATNIELLAGSSTMITHRWHPNQEGSFRVQCWASIGCDTDPSNNERDIIGNIGSWNPFLSSPEGDCRKLKKLKRKMSK